MIGIHSEISEEKRFATRLLTSTTRLDCNKDRVDLCQGIGIVGLQDPALLGSVVFIKDAEIQSLLPVRPTPAPGLKYWGDLRPLLIQVVGVKDERLPFRVKHPAVRLSRGTMVVNIVHFGDVEITGAHEFPDISVVGQ